MFQTEVNSNSNCNSNNSNSNNGNGNGKRQQQKSVYQDTEADIQDEQTSEQFLPKEHPAARSLDFKCSVAKKQAKAGETEMRGCTMSFQSTPARDCTSLVSFC